jgi:hypothetical protein
VTEGGYCPADTLGPLEASGPASVPVDDPMAVSPDVGPGGELGAAVPETAPSFGSPAAGGSSPPQTGNPGKNSAMGSVRGALVVIAICAASKIFL